jgi:hypothetical protein
MDRFEAMGSKSLSSDWNQLRGYNSARIILVVNGDHTMHSAEGIMVDCGDLAEDAMRCGDDVLEEPEYQPVITDGHSRSSRMADNTRNILCEKR